MRAEGIPGSGSLTVSDDALVYESDHTRFVVPFHDIAIAGEYTTAGGPAADDYFLVFITPDGVRHDASFYAAGREAALDALAAFWQDPIRPTLAASTSLASNILWPPQYAGKPLFTYEPRPAVTAFDRVRSRLGFAVAEEHLSAFARSAMEECRSQSSRRAPQHAALVADDDPNVVQLIRAEIAKRPDWVVDVASNGEEAWAKAQRRNYDVIVLDLMMPRMDGYEVLRRLRHRRFEQRKRVIVVTGRPANLRAADQRIVEGVMQKPLRLRELNEHVDRIAAAEQSNQRALA